MALHAPSSVNLSTAGPLIGGFTPFSVIFADGSGLLSTDSPFFTYDYTYLKLPKISAQSGSAALPTYSFENDPDSGIYSFFPNFLGFSIGGSDVMTLHSSGLSIGTTAPSVSKLYLFKSVGSLNSIAHLYNADTAESSLCFQNTVAPFTMGVNSDGRFILAYYPTSIASSGQLMSVTTGGNFGIGIGNTAASARLHLLSTTEQLRVAYDASNYFSVTVGSTGVATFNSIGSSAPTFYFQDNFRVGTSSTDVLAQVGKAVVVGDTNSNASDADNIIAAFAQNLTQGFAIRYNGLYATGSNANVSLLFQAKAANIFFNDFTNFYIEGTSYSYHGGGLRLGGSDSTNTIYLNGGMRLSCNGGLYGLQIASSGTISQTGANAFDGAAPYCLYLSDLTSMAAGVGAGLLFAGQYGSGPAGFAVVQGFKENGTNNNYAGAWRVFTRINGGSLTERIRIDSVGRLGIGVTSPTAFLHLLAGTATANTAPIKLSSGTNLTTAETGAIEYNGTNLFFTRTGTTRENVFVGNDAAAAPATNTIGVIADYYGTSATRVLTTPNSWASVNIAGTVYKIPLYT